MVRENNDDHLKRFSAFQYATELSKPGSTTIADRMAASRLIGYAKRQDAVADLAIESILRQNPVARQIYDMALGACAMAQSDLAMAAAGGTSIARKVGAHRVELIEETEGVYLIIYVANDSAAPTKIEVRVAEGAGARLALGAPLGGIIQQRLDLLKPEPQQIHAALIRHDSSIFLL